jgi:copper homeostasis protein
MAMPRVLLEVIVQTMADARQAVRGGADRLEVVRDIRDGGLTPPLSLVRAIAEETALPLRVMVRENAGYAMNPDELPLLRGAAVDFSSLGVDGIVIGFAERGRLALDDVRRVLEAAPAVRVTFHRAFDQLRDPVSAIDELTRVAQIDRILTDGGGGDAASRCRRLGDYRARAGDRLAILAGGGVDEAILAHLAANACVREIHVGRIAREGNDPEGAVSADRVRRLRDLLG